MAQHTPTPWGIERHPHSGHPMIAAQYGTAYVVADCSNNELSNETEEANAAFIVRAVNCHDDLLSAAEKCDAILTAGIMNSAGRDIVDAMTSLRAAISRARNGDAS